MGDNDEQRRLHELEQEVRNMRAWAFGNGGKGADERIRRIEDAMTGLKDAMSGMKDATKELRDAERRRGEAERGARRERRGVLIGVGLVLSALVIGGAQFAIQLTNKVDTLVRLWGNGAPPPGL